MKATILLIMLIIIGSFGTAYAENYLIGPGDILQISVWGNPDLSVQQLPVRPDGFISVPVVGDVKAEGLTPAQLKAKLEKEYRTYIKAPTVSVLVTAINSSKIQNEIKVVGAVRKPGMYPYAKGMTALDALLMAGGFTEFASQNNVVIVRRQGSEVFHIKVRLKDVINDGDLTKNVDLEPGDMVNVNSGLF